VNLGEPIAIGNTAKLYLYSNRIIKVFNKDLPPNVSLYEVKKQEYVYSCGLNVPKIVDMTEINNRQAIVMEYIDGNTLGDLLFNNVDQTEHYIRICVNVQQKIHAITADPDILEPMPVKMHRQIDLVQDLNKGQKEILFNRLESLIDDPKLCHGDFHPFNLMMSDDKVYILDWVDASCGDIRADVFRSYLLFLETSKTLAESYLDTYCCQTGISRDEIFQWAPIVAGARLSENVSLESKKRLMEIVTGYLP